MRIQFLYMFLFIPLFLPLTSLAQVPTATPTIICCDGPAATVFSDPYSSNSSLGNYTVVYLSGV
ncbi:MAG: hypothetical protein ACREL1_09395 [bacterium]